MQSFEERGVYGFGPYRLDRARRRLTRSGRPLDLTPKAFDVLAVLVEAGGEVVGREELMDRVWPDTAVVDANLTQTVSVLRKVLGDTAAVHEYIATVPGRGYQFTAPVERLAAPEPPDAPIDAPIGVEGEGGAAVAAVAEGRPRRRALRAIAGGLALAALLFALVRLAVDGPGAAPGGADTAPSLAILPLTVLTPTTLDPALGVGLSDAVTNRLSGHRGLSVRPTQTVLATTGGRLEPMAAGRRLGVGFVLSGTIRRAEEQVRASVQLIDVERGQPMWAATFDQPIGALFTLEDRISERIARSLALDLAGSGEAAGRPAAVQGEAYRELLLGRARYLERSLAGYEDALRHFERALEIDPEYAPALGQLAMVRALTAFNGRSSDAGRPALTRAEREARRAIELDPDLPAAHVALGAVRMNERYDWVGATESFERAVRLDPDDFQSRYLLAMALVLVGDETRAWREAGELRLHRRLTGSPSDVNQEFSAGLLALFLGRYDEARETLAGVIAVRPDLAGVRMYHAVCLAALGEREAALDELEIATLHYRSGEQARATLAHYLGRSADRERRARARGILRELEGRPAHDRPRSFDLAIAHAGVGDRKASVRYLRAAFENREVLPILVQRDPRFDPLREEPEFRRLLREMNLAPPGATPARVANG